MGQAVRIIFTGPPGSGKGTQAQRLVEHTGLIQLSSGHVLRQQIKVGSEIGKKAASYVESGGLVPDDVITGVMLAAIDELEPDAGFILDGFPRTVPQAEALTAGLKDRNISIDRVLDFQMCDETIVARISGRTVCTKCGTTYNTEFLPPKREGVCDICGGEVLQRKDDQPDVVRNRLKTYREQTAPLETYYRERGLLVQINAEAPANKVEQAVQRVIEDIEKAACGQEPPRSN